MGMDCDSMSVMDFVSNNSKKLAYMWYVMDPNDHLYQHVNDVPDYYKEVTPAFIFVIILEQFLHLLRGKPLMRFNDSITNICQGILVEIFKIPMYGIELWFYTWIFSNYRIYALPWNSAYTWLLCMVGTDFFFYWMHRATHQISILWSFHEPHHSSEELNLTTPLRLSVFTSATLWLTYFPMAFFIPPSIFLVHYQLNIIFQYWLHSEYIPRLGALEYVFVTPSHHRVHHGRSRRCIDKNFGSIFILWDRMFGTFEDEDNQKVIFGVTKPLQTFSPIHIQTHHLQEIWQKFQKADGFWNKISYVFKGPGWSPGKPWLGLVDEIPEPTDDHQKYDPLLPTWLYYYIVFHSAALVIGYLQMILNLPSLPSRIIIFSSLYMVFTTISIGHLLDLSAWSHCIELVRCPLYFLLDTVLRNSFDDKFFVLYVSMLGFRTLFMASFVFWMCSLPLFSDRERRRKSN